MHTVIYTYTYSTNVKHIWSHKIICRIFCFISEILFIEHQNSHIKLENLNIATMSNRYLLRQMVLDTDKFFQRMKCFYDFWKVRNYLLNIYIRPFCWSCNLLKIWLWLSFQFHQKPETELENDAVSSVDCIMVAVGDDYGSVYNKSVSLHVSTMWFSI